MAWTEPMWQWSANDEATVDRMNQIRDNVLALMPVGAYLYLLRASTTVETLVEGCWLECNGASVLRASYPALNTILNGLGYPFGTADASRMTLPDFRSRAPYGHPGALGHATMNQLGKNDGLALASRTLAPSDTVSITIGSHTHGSGGLSVTGSPGISSILVDGSFQTSPPVVNNVSAGTLDVGGSTDAAGGGSDTDTVSIQLPGLVAGVWFIKAK